MKSFIAKRCITIVEKKGWNLKEKCLRNQACFNLSNSVALHLCFILALKTQKVRFWRS
jgi:hypothetical protein